MSGTFEGHALIPVAHSNGATAVYVAAQLIAYRYLSEAFSLALTHC